MMPFKKIPLQWKKFSQKSGLDSCLKNSVSRASFKRLATGMAMLAALVAHAQVQAAKSMINDDDRFMALRDAAMHDDAKSAREHAAQLSNYEIPSYVEYYVLKTRMRSVSATEIHDFLNKYEGSAIADRLRNDYLLALGWRGEWSAFDAMHPQFIVADDLQVKCYALLSKANKQQKVALEAKQLLTSPRDFGEACNSLITYLYEHGQFSEADLWNQMRYAAEQAALPMVKRFAKTLNLPETSALQAIEKPAAVLKKAPMSGHAGHELYLIALGRMAKTDLDAAVDAMEKHQSKFTEKETAQGWANIALQAALKLKPEAIQYWQKGHAANYSQEAYQWRVRSALRETNWHAVKQAIAALPENLRTDPAWIYWQGRALQNEGKKEEAAKLFASIAGQMNFYGQLALEESGRKIGVPLSAKPVSKEELAPLAENKNLQRALKFYSMNLRLEGTREWNWELRSMSERQHLVAAELARQNNLLDRMVNTSDRTKGELDFSQRFPTPFNDSMYKMTQAIGLDMAWAYGLIRQESRFVMNAKSHVGASGLMQIMPSTARYIAKKIGLGNFVPEQVNDIETNITLGTNYLNMVLTELGGSQALASAAYNAGPGRPRAWRASLSKPVEGAIFAETIPFTETRGYVKNVLSNATYYAAIIEKKPQSLKARLGVVVPKGMTAEEMELP